MSILNTLYRIGTLTRANLPRKLDPARTITFSLARYSNTEEEDTAETKNPDVPEVVPREIVSVETSIKYMNSDAYKETYGNDPVWKLYRRNHKGAFPPKKTRKTCIRSGVISTGNPCPICRDEYLVIDHTNVKLLEQFINKHNGDIISYLKTGICQKRHKELLIALFRARDCGTITYDVPIRHYNYADWKVKGNN